MDHTDRAPQALQSVNAAPICPGCDRPFRPARRNQRHCRPSCRVLALRRRRQSGPLLAVAASIGHVEPDVMDPPD